MNAGISPPDNICQPHGCFLPAFCYWAIFVPFSGLDALCEPTSCWEAVWLRALLSAVYLTAYTSHTRSPKTPTLDRGLSRGAEVSGNPNLIFLKPHLPFHILPLQKLLHLKASALARGVHLALQPHQSALRDRRFQFNRLRRYPGPSTNIVELTGDLRRLCARDLRSRDRKCAVDSQLNPSTPAL